MTHHAERVQVDEHGKELRSEPNRRKPPDSLWVAVSNFGQGVSYVLGNSLPETMFTALGASLEVIGLTSLFHLAWNLKFLWAPWVDRYETKRQWILGTQLAVAVLSGVISVLVYQHALFGVAVGLAVLCVFAATYDIATDAFYLEALDESGRSRYVGLRAAGFRLAMTAGAGAFVWIGGALDWSVAWGSAAVLVFALAMAHTLLLPRCERTRRPWTDIVRGWTQRQGLLVALFVIVVWSEFRWRGLASVVGWIMSVSGLSAPGFAAAALLVVLLMGVALLPWLRRLLKAVNLPVASVYLDFLNQPQMGRVLALVVLFRVGESFVLKMRFPFLSRVVGMSTDFYGAMIVGVGGVASIAATLLGGWLIARDGLRRWIWPFMIAQNVFNLLYMAVALVPEPSRLGIPIITGLVFLEHMGAGLGTSVFLVYLMRCVDPRHRAAHMSILTAVMSIGYAVAGIYSGFLAKWLGFASYFGFTFLVTLPSMVLLFFVPHIDESQPEPRAK